MSARAQAEQNGGAPAARGETLIEEHLSLVHGIARRLLQASRVDAELDDLVSSGTVGLIEAARNFDPERGIAFSTFAVPRIRGAMLDDLRKQDHVPRSVRKRLRELAQAESRLRSRLHRPPKEQEVAGELEITVQELRKWRREIHGAERLSLEEPIDDDEGRTPRQLLPTAEGEEEIAGRLARKEELEILSRELQSLTERERLILSLYYFEELKLREIAEVVGGSQSRISQIRGGAVEKLRARMEGIR